MGRHEVAIVRQKSHSLKIMISFTQYLFRFNDQLMLNKLSTNENDEFWEKERIIDIYKIFSLNRLLPLPLFQIY